MIDRFGRRINYLRLSVTERCTLRCEYCRVDEGICPKAAELSTSEFIRITRACANLGITKVRLTGGEPLLRRDILEIIRGISALETIREITMTTNGQMLPGQSAALKRAGISRLNISLDSLDPQTYHEMTGGDLGLVLTGIDEAIATGLLPVRINVVLVRGKNDHEVDDFIEFTKDRPLDVRFIELMPVGELGQDEMLRVSTDELLGDRPCLQPLPPRYPGQVSSDYGLDGYMGRVGFISPISHKFCGNCNRIRIMSDGMLRPCLGNNSEISLKEALQAGDEVLVEAIRSAIYNKPASHHFELGFRSEKNMSRIGG